MTAVKAALRRAMGIDRLHTRIDQLEERLQESYEETRARSTSRWRETTPNIGLTWGIDLPGEPFIEAVKRYGGFAPGRRVLEIGPGYGRLLRTANAMGVEFETWTGLDLSSANVEHLRTTFPGDRFRFVEGDAMDADLDDRWNLLVSSLTLKHIYPSFEPAFENLLRYADASAMLIFDVIEGEGRMFEDNRVTYIRRYSKPELQDMMGRLGLNLVAFDIVVHTKEYPRLLVVAQR